MDLPVTTSIRATCCRLLPCPTDVQQTTDTSGDFQGKCRHQQAVPAVASAHYNLCAGSGFSPVKGCCQRLHQALHSLPNHNISSLSVRIPLGLYIESKQRRYGKCFAVGTSGPHREFTWNENNAMASALPVVTHLLRRHLSRGTKLATGQTMLT